VAIFHVAKSGLEAGLYSLLYFVGLAASLVFGYVSWFGSKKNGFDDFVKAHFASAASFVSFNMAAWVGLT
jgi:hypothetical protein